MVGFTNHVFLWNRCLNQLVALYNPIDVWVNAWLKSSWAHSCFATDLQFKYKIHWKFIISIRFSEKRVFLKPEGRNDNRPQSLINVFCLSIKLATLKTNFDAILMIYGMTIRNNFCSQDSFDFFICLTMLTTRPQS